MHYPMWDEILHLKMLRYLTLKNVKIFFKEKQNKTLTKIFILRYFKLDPYNHEMDGFFLFIVL